MTTVKVRRQADDGVWVYQEAGPIGAGSEVPQAIFVPTSELISLATTLWRVVEESMAPLVALTVTMEPLLHLAYHTLDADPAMELYKDAYARLTIGDIRRLAWQIDALKQHTIL